MAGPPALMRGPPRADNQDREDRSDTTDPVSRWRICYEDLPVLVGYPRFSTFWAPPSWAPVLRISRSLTV